MKRITLSFALVLSLCFLLASCAWMDLGRISEIDDTPSTPQTEPGSNLVAKFEGTGMMDTAQFTVTRNWKIEWASSGFMVPYFYVYNSDGDNVAIYGGTYIGATYFYGIGTFYISVIAVGPWKIEITYQ
jgi:hypothetical protein